MERMGGAIEAHSGRLLPSENWPPQNKEGRNYASSDVTPVPASGVYAEQCNPPCAGSRCVTIEILLIKGAQVSEIEYFVHGFVQSRQDQWCQVPPDWDLEWAIFEKPTTMSIEKETQTVVSVVFKNWSSNKDRRARIGALYTLPK